MMVFRGWLMTALARPLSFHLWALVLASLVPAAAVAAALAASAYEPAWPNALALVMSVMALGAGIFVSVLIARSLRRGLADIAVEAGMLRNGLPLAQIHSAVRELDAIAQSLAAVGTRLANPPARREAVAPAPDRAASASAGEWRWDLATGAMDWSDRASLLFGLPAGAAPSRARLLGLTHVSDRAAVVAWLASLARGEDADALDFRLCRGDGATRRIRATAAAERDATGRLVGIAGAFADRGASVDVIAQCPAAGMGSCDATALLEAVAARTRERARAAGVELRCSFAPGLGCLHGDAASLETALASLLTDALTFTPRGGPLAFRAVMEASGEIRVTLGAGDAGSGLGLAGAMVELNCGALAAHSIAAARGLIEANGGSLFLAPAPASGGAITIMLAGAGAVRAAA
jgi:PAS domain-containing protein